MWGKIENLRQILFLTEKLNNIKGALTDVGRTYIGIAAQVGRNHVIVNRSCISTSDLIIRRNLRFRNFASKYSRIASG